MPSPHDRLRDIEAVSGAPFLSPLELTIPDAAIQEIWTARRSLATVASNQLLRMCLADKATARAQSADFDEAEWAPNRTQIDEARCQTLPLLDERLADSIRAGIRSTVRLVGLSTAPPYSNTVMLKKPQAERKAIDTDIRRRYGVDFVERLIRTDRSQRGLLYCMPGNKGEQALAIAQELRDRGIGAAAITGGDTRDLRTKSMPWKAPDVIAAYNSGEISVITTTDARPHSSQLFRVDFVGLLRRFMQREDRDAAIEAGTAYNPDTPVTLLFQMVSMLKHMAGSARTPDQTAWDLFGRAAITQGEYIGPYRSEEGTGCLQQVVASLPKEVREAYERIDGVTLHEAQFGAPRYRAPVPGTVPFRSLLGADESPMDHRTAQGYLDRADIPYTRNRDETTGEVDFYFDPEHLPAMRAAVKPLANEGMWSVGMLENETGETHYIINKAIGALGLTGQSLRGRSNNIATDHFTPEDRLAVLAYIEAIPVAEDDDIQVQDLARELHTQRDRLVDLLERLHAVTPVDKRIAVKGRPAAFLTKDQADIARGDREINIPFLPEDEAWTAIRDVMARTGRHRRVVDTALAMMGWEFCKKPFKIIDTSGAENTTERSVIVDFLPALVATEIERLIEAAEFPEGAITCKQYATSRGYDVSGIEGLTTQYKVPVIEIQRGTKTYQLLNEASQATLDKIIESLHTVQPGWRSLVEVVTTLDVAYDTVKKHIPAAYLAKEHPEALRDMRPDPTRLARQVYMHPDFTVWVARRTMAFRLHEPDLRLNTAQISLLAGKSQEIVRARIAELGITTDSNTLQGPLLSTILEAYDIGKLGRPKRLGDPPAIAPLNEPTVMPPSEQSIQTSLPPVVVTHSRATPAGELILGRNGVSRAMSAAPTSHSKPREEPFVLESPPWAAATLASSVRGSGFSATGTNSRQPGESTHGLPPERAKRPATHLSDGPDVWAPTVAKVTPSMIFSRTESLTATQICARLGIPAEDADATIAAALERIDPGDAAPKHITLEDGSTVTVYSGSLLLALRQQLTGIPLEHVAVALNLDKEKLERAIKYLQRHRYSVFDDRISPGAFALLSNDPARATATPTKDE